MTATYLRPGLLVLLIVCSSADVVAQPQVLVTGHYPPGQSGIRGASTPEPGVMYTNFSRFFTNLEVVGAPDTAPGDIDDELRYANISMITWTTDRELFGLRYGALAGVPFATGDVRSSDRESSGIGLGDILLTPLSLYGRSARADYQVQFTVWTPSGEVLPGIARQPRDRILGAPVFGGRRLLPGWRPRHLERLRHRPRRAELRAT